MDSLDTERRKGLARALFWELAVARKLHQTALAERRFDDANYYSKQIQAAEQRARRLLDSMAG